MHKLISTSVWVGVVVAALFPHNGFLNNIIGGIAVYFLIDYITSKKEN